MRENIGDGLPRLNTGKVVDPRGHKFAMPGLQLRISRHFLIVGMIRVDESLHERPDGLGDDARVLVERERERERLELRPEGAIDQAALLELQAVVVPLEVGRFPRKCRASSRILERRRGTTDNTENR